ncbi:hypothetical protein AYK24_06570 [Thermoplasmatales archaeon SG8-52-4]|nr:MAG: hypothetical protein AYK24_06570 [Thermoplasmatales archaeon SG8-52-4]
METFIHALLSALKIGGITVAGCVAVYIAARLAGAGFARSFHEEFNRLTIKLSKDQKNEKNKDE